MFPTSFERAHQIATDERIREARRHAGIRALLRLASRHDPVERPRNRSADAPRRVLRTA